jgi:hypothetical protein
MMDPKKLPIGHPEPFAICHPEPIRFAQDKLREGSS